MLTDERRAEIEEAVKELGQARAACCGAETFPERVEGAIQLMQSARHGSLERMARELFAEIDRLNEVASDSSELAATTIAGLEVQVERLRAERDALMALLVKEEVHHDAAAGTYPPTGRWWVVPHDDTFGGDVFEDRDKAVASVWRDAYRAVRKSRGDTQILTSQEGVSDGPVS
jgi:hypothetical protein